MNLIVIGRFLIASPTLVIGVILGLSSGSLSAEEYGLFTYRVVGDTVQITGYPREAVGDVVIPAEIDGKPVTSIGY